MDLHLQRVREIERERERERERNTRFSIESKSPSILSLAGKDSYVNCIICVALDGSNRLFILFIRISIWSFIL